MRTRNFFYLLLMLVASFSLVSCGGDDAADDIKTPQQQQTTDGVDINGVLNVNVHTAGMLESLIGGAKKFSTTKLKIGGQLNAKDISCLRDMMQTSNGGRLEYLDMADASIVAGGGSYIPSSRGGYDEEYYQTQYNMITESMFESCDALHELILPNSVVRISHYMFGYGFESNVRSITIGSSIVGSIDHDDDGRLGVLAWMKNLEEIKVHKDNSKFSSEDGIMYSRDKKVLYNVPCKYKRSSLNIPNTVETIASGAFVYCNFSSIKLPSSVRKLEERAFGWSQIKSIDTGSVEEMESGVFCPGCEASEIILSKNITAIPPETFRGCTNLTSITIPASVRCIGEYAFYDCKSLKSIYMESSTPPALGYEAESTDNVFTWIDYESINLYVPSGSWYSYLTTLPWSGLNIIEQ